MIYDVCQPLESFGGFNLKDGNNDKTRKKGDCDAIHYNHFTSNSCACNQSMN